MGFSRFPRKKRSIGLRCRPPHACIHLEKFMYPLALVSGAPHKAYIFRFNTPTNNTFPASGTHTCLILRGYPPPSSHTFLAKSEGVNPPLMFIHYQKCRIHPPYSWTSWGRGSFHIECGSNAWMWKPHWVILRCFSRCNCNFHTQVQEQSACEMLSTFIQAAARKCQTRLPARCLPQFGHSGVQRHTKKIPSVRRARPMSSQHSQPLGASTAQVQRKGAKDRCQKHWQTAAQNSKISMPQCRHSSEDDEYVHLHFQIFRIYFWTSRFFFGFNPTSNTTDKPS